MAPAVIPPVETLRTEVPLCSAIDWNIQPALLPCLSLMPDIVLATLNAKYIHASFGLRYLMANLGDLRPRARLLEFDINQRPVDIAEALLAQHPRIVGLGVYIWNASPAAEVVAAVKCVRPDVTVILGGPEVSFETNTQPIVKLADHVITGEADLKFAEVCARLLRGEVIGQKLIPADPPHFDRLVLPYDLYDAEDVAHRVIYVEASRGCPFTCEFCLSSLDVPVRQAPLPEFLEALRGLLDRGVTRFKFVDRTFNLNSKTSRALLEFCLDHYRPGHFYHFEMIPDRLPDALREIIARFPAGSLQFEVGIQSFDEQVCALISRRQNIDRIVDNFHFLRTRTGVHIHADLIGGLPGESLESFANGFDKLVALGPQEIQVGMLKRLRGTPIARHDREWEMIYHPHPPYEILQTKLIPFADMQRMRRFARYWDLVANSGNFVETTPRLWAAPGGVSSPFEAFMAWSEWLFERVRRTDSIALMRLAKLLFEYLTEERGYDQNETAHLMWRDYQRGGRSDCPGFLAEHLPDAARHARTGGRRSALKRQARHWAG